MSTAQTRAPSAHRHRTALDRVRGLGGLAALGMRAGAALVRPPFAWRSGFALALGLTLRRAAVATLVLVAAWSASTIGVQLGGFFAQNGQLDRLGGYGMTTALRWFGPAIAVVALAVAAGGRLVAELAVEGDDGGSTERESAVAARQMLVFAVAGVILSLLAAPVSVAAFVAVAAATLEASPAVVLATLFANATWPDLLGGLVRAGLSGLLVGLVCCHHPFAARRAIAAGQGVENGAAHAVRSALVGSLVAVVFVNLVLAIFTLATFPDLRFSR